MITLLNTETGHLEHFTLQELLDNLNRDRSSEWSDYTVFNTAKEVIEAVEDFTEYTFEFKKEDMK